MNKMVHIAQNIPRDFKTFAELSRALWVDPVVSKPIAVETMSAAALLDLSDDKIVSRATIALLERFSKYGSAAHVKISLEKISGDQQPFFLLSLEERFCLIALYLGRWSYKRLAEILDVSQDQVEKLSWRARVQLGLIKAIYPIGSRFGTLNCPEYNVQRPWTQRFMDEEFSSPAEKFFLQNHLLACPTCSLALNRCRELYYAVEAILPRVKKEDEEFVQNLYQVYQEAKWVKTKHYWQRNFFKKKDIQWMLGILILLILYRYLNINLSSG